MTTMTEDWLAQHVERLTAQVQAMPEREQCPKCGGKAQVTHWCDRCAETPGLPETARGQIPNEPRERALALLTRECEHYWVDLHDGYARCDRCGSRISLDLKGAASVRNVPVPRNLYADLSLASWPEPVREALVLAWLRAVVACFGWELETRGNFWWVVRHTPGHHRVQGYQTPWEAVEQALGGQDAA